MPDEITPLSGLRLSPADLDRDMGLVDTLMAAAFLSMLPRVLNVLLFGEKTAAPPRFFLVLVSEHLTAPFRATAHTYIEGTARAVLEEYQAEVDVETPYREPR